MNKKFFVRIAVAGLVASVILGGSVLLTGARFAFASSTVSIPAYQMIHLRTSAAVSNEDYTVVAQQPFTTNPGAVQLTTTIYVPAGIQNQGTLTCALSFDATNTKSLLEIRTFTLTPSGNTLTMSTNRGYSIAGDSTAYVQCSTANHYTPVPVSIAVDMDLTIVANASAANTGIN
jgi:hypothetical protein